MNEGLEINVEMGLCTKEMAKENPIKDFEILIEEYKDKWSTQMYDYFKECLNEIKKKEKALEIIVHKGVNVGYLKDAWNHNKKVNYNKDLIITDDTIRVLACKDSTPLTQEEYDSLKKYCHEKNNIYDLVE